MRDSMTMRGVLLFLSVCVGASAAHAALIAHWKLDEPAGTSGVASVADSGPQLRFHGTPDLPTGAPVEFGFAGATDTTGTAAGFVLGSIDVPYDPELNLPSFTFCAWAFVNGLGDFQSVVTSRHDAFPDLAGYILYCDPTGFWNFWTGRSGGWDGLAGPPVAIGQWTHVAISFDATTNTKTLYVDGAGTSTDLQMYVPNQVRNLHLGGGGDFGNQYSFNGSLDEAALWNVALPSDAIMQIRDGGPSAVPEGLVAYWKLDEAQGTAGAGTVADSGGGGYDGSTPAAPLTMGTPGALPATGTAFTCANASVNVPFDTDLNPASLTVTAWALPAATAGYQSVITSRYDNVSTGGTEGYILYHEPGGFWAFWTGGGVPGWPVLAGPPVVLGAWQHLAISFDAGTSTKKLYVDGVEAASVTDQAYTPNTLQELHIGGGGDLGNEFRFMGSIDDVGLWDEALPLDAIIEVMENGVAGEIPFGPHLKRGDVNTDRAVNIADAIALLGHLFASKPAPTCRDAADANDDGQLNIADAITILGHLFGGKGPLPAPFDACGEDPSIDALDCLDFPPCAG